MTFLYSRKRVAETVSRLNWPFKRTHSAVHGASQGNRGRENRRSHSHATSFRLRLTHRYVLSNDPTGVAVLFSGGTIRSDFDARSGSTIDISGGLIEENFTARTGSAVSLSGGIIVDDFRANSGSSVDFIGDEFRLNNAAITDLSSGFTGGSENVFTGTLADGSVFIFHSDEADFLAAGTTTLSTTALPPANITPQQVSSGTTTLKGLRPGQDLTVSGTGAVPDNFSAVSSQLAIQGGTVGNNLEVAYTDVSMTGGTVGNDFDIFDGGDVVQTGGQIGDNLSVHNGGRINIVSGTVGDGAVAFEGGTLNIVGGDVGDNIVARDGSTVNITAGTTGTGFVAESGSTVALVGGNVGSGFVAESGSTLTIVGGEFQNGLSSVSSLPNGYEFGQIINGTLSDGTVFILAPINGDTAAPGTVTLATTSLPAADLTPQFVSSGQEATQGLRAGQELTLSGTGTLGKNYAAVSATLNIEGGSVAAGLEVLDTEVNVSGGMIGENFTAYFDSEINVTGGQIGDNFTSRGSNTVFVDGGAIGDNFRAFQTVITMFDGEIGDDLFTISGTTLGMSGGSIGREAGIHGPLVVTGGSIGPFVRIASLAQVFGGAIGPNGAVDGGTLNFHGGSLGAGFRALSGSEVNIFGGDIGDEFLGAVGSDVHLFVRELVIDGDTINLNLGEQYVISQRDGTLLEAVLSDGSTLDFILNSSIVEGEDAFLFDTLLTATLVAPIPEPTSFALMSIVWCAGGIALYRRQRRT